MEVIIPVGYAFFQKSKYSQPALQRQLTIRRKEVLYNTNWIIYDEDFAKWALILQNIHEAQPMILDLGNNRYPTMLNCLLTATFTRLKEIILQNNRIVSVEKLCLVSMPLLQSINLQENYIVSIKSFRKNSLKKLQYLNLNGNRISDIHYLSEGHNHHLEKLLLEWNDSPVIGHNITWAAKLPANGLAFIRIEGSNRIQQPKIDKMLKARYPQTRIWRNQEKSIQD